MSSKHLVCQGALCKCAYGTTPDTLVVATQSKHYINEKEPKKKLTATHKDIGQTFKNNNFGSCSKMRNKPCKVDVTEWTGYYEKMFFEINQGYALVETSKATCAVGEPDCIEIIEHGQVSEVTEQNIKNINSDAIHQLCPVIELSATNKQHKVHFKIK